MKTTSIAPPCRLNLDLDAPNSPDHELARGAETHLEEPRTDIYSRYNGRSDIYRTFCHA